MAILWTIFITASLIFIILYGILFKATIRQPEEMSKEFATVYAGDADAGHQGASPVNIDLTTSTFLDKKGNPVNLDEYDGYVVSGDSMELANIKDGNLLLVHKDEIFTDSTPLPGVFVLKRETPQPHQGKYKLRRIWATAYIGQTNIDHLVRGIMTHPEFMQLSNNKELCLDEEPMLNEFLGEKGRLDIYKKEHPQWKDVGSDDANVVISTTLRTEQVNDIHTVQGKHISFSIHPAKLVVGRVAYVYSQNKASS